MIKNLLVHLLQPLLSSYIHDFNEDSLSIDSLSTFSLHHISLRTDTLSSFLPLFVTVPLQFSKIVIEKITVAVGRSLVEILPSSSSSLSSLFRFPCSIVIEGVYVNGTLRSTFTYNDRLRLELEAFDNYVNGVVDPLYHRYSPTLLASSSSSSSSAYTELSSASSNELKQSSNPWPESSKGLNRTVLRIVQYILDNIAIQITGIHIQLRYETNGSSMIVTPDRGSNAIVGIMMQDLRILHPENTVGVSSVAVPRTDAQTITSKGIQIQSFGIYCDTYRTNTLPNYETESVRMFEHRMKQEGLECWSVPVGPPSAQATPAVSSESSPIIVPPQSTYEPTSSSSSSSSSSATVSVSSPLPPLLPVPPLRSSRIAAVNARQTLGQIPFSPVQLISPLPPPVWTVPTPKSASSNTSSLSSDSLLETITVTHDWLLSPLHAFITVRLTDQGRLVPDELSTAIKQYFYQTPWEEEFISNIPWAWLTEQQQKSHKGTTNTTGTVPSSPFPIDNDEETAAFIMKPNDWELFRTDPVALLSRIWYAQHQSTGPTSTTATNTTVQESLVPTISTVPSYLSRIWKTTIDYIPFLPSALKPSETKPPDNTYVGGPLVQWAYDIGLVNTNDIAASTENVNATIPPSTVLIRLLRELEEAATTLRPSLLYATINIPNVQLTLTNNQYIALLGMVDAFMFRPFHVPLPKELHPQSRLYRQLLEEIALEPSSALRDTYNAEEFHDYRNYVYGKLYRHTYLHYQQYVPVTSSSSSSSSATAAESVVPSALTASTFDLHLMKQYLFQQYYVTSGRIMELISTRLRTESEILEEKYNDQSFVPLHRLKDYLYPSSLRQRQRLLQDQQTILEQVMANIGLPVNRNGPSGTLESRQRTVATDNQSSSYGKRNHYSASIFRYNGYIWHRLPFVDFHIQVQDLSVHLLRIAETMNSTTLGGNTVASTPSLPLSRSHGTTVVPLLSLRLSQLFLHLDLSSTDLIAIDKPELQVSQYYQELHDYQTVLRYYGSKESTKNETDSTKNIFDQLWILQDKSPSYGILVDVQLQDIDLWDNLTLMDQDKFTLIYRTNKSNRTDTLPCSERIRETNIPSPPLVERSTDRDSPVHTVRYPTGEATTEVPTMVPAPLTEPVAMDASSWIIDQLPCACPPLIRLALEYTDTPVLKLQLQGRIEKLDIVPSISILAPLTNFLTSASISGSNDTDSTDNEVKKNIRTYGTANTVQVVPINASIDESNTLTTPVIEATPVMNISSSLFIDAPRIIIPLDPSITLTSNLVIDLGTLTLQGTEESEATDTTNVALMTDNLRFELSSFAMYTVIGNPHAILLYNASTKGTVSFYNEDPYVLAPVTMRIDAWLRRTSTASSETNATDDLAVSSALLSIPRIPWWVQARLTIPDIQILVTTAKLRHILGLIQIITLMMGKSTSPSPNTIPAEETKVKTNDPSRTPLACPDLSFIQDSITSTMASLQPAYVSSSVSGTPKLSKADITIVIRNIRLVVAESSYDIDPRDKEKVYHGNTTVSDPFFDTTNCRLLTVLQFQRLFGHIDYLNDTTVAGKVSLGYVRMNDLLREQRTHRNPRYPSKLLSLLTVGNINEANGHGTTVSPSVLRILLHRQGTIMIDTTTNDNDRTCPWGAIDLYMGMLGIVINRDTVQQLLRLMTYQPEEDILIHKILSLTQQRSKMYHERMRSTEETLPPKATEAEGIAHNASDSNEETVVPIVRPLVVSNPLSFPFLGTIQLQGVAIVLNTECDILPSRRSEPSFVPRTDTSSSPALPVTNQAHTMVENVALQAEHAMDVAQVAPRMEQYLKTERLQQESAYQYRQTKHNILSLLEGLNYGYGSYDTVSSVAYLYRGTVALVTIEGVLVSVDVRNAVSSMTVQVEKVFGYGTGYLPLNTVNDYPVPRKVVPLLTVTNDNYDRTMDNLVTVDDMIDNCIRTVPLFELDNGTVVDKDAEELCSSFTNPLPLVVHRRNAGILLDTIFTGTRSNDYRVPCGIEVHASIGNVNSEAHIPHMLAMINYFTEGPLNDGIASVSASNSSSGSSTDRSKDNGNPPTRNGTESEASNVPEPGTKVMANVPTSHPLPLLYLGLGSIHFRIPLSSTVPLYSSGSTLDLRMNGLSLSTIDNVRPNESLPLYQLSRIPGYWRLGNAGTDSSIPYAHQHRGNATIFLDPSLAFQLVRMVQENISSIASIRIPIYTGTLPNVRKGLTTELFQAVTGTVELGIHYRSLQRSSSSTDWIPIESNEILLYVPSIVWDTYLRPSDQQYGLPTPFPPNRIPSSVPNQDTEGTDLRTRLSIEPSYVALTSLHIQVLNRYIDYAVKNTHHSLNTPAPYLVRDETNLRSSPLHVTYTERAQRSTAAAAPFTVPALSTTPPSSTMEDTAAMSNIGLSHCVPSSAISIPAPPSFEMNKCLATIQCTVKGIQVLCLNGNQGLTNVSTMEEIMRQVTYTYNVSSSSSSSSVINPLAHLWVRNFTVHGLMDIYGTVSIDMNLEHVAFDDVRSYVNLYPAYRHCLFLSNDSNMMDKPNERQYPLTVSAVYRSTYLPSSDPSVPATIRNETTNDHLSEEEEEDDQRLVTAFPSPSAYVIVDLQLHRLRFLSGSVIMAVVNWAQQSLTIPHRTDASSTVLSSIENVLMDDFVSPVSMQSILHHCHEIERSYERWYNQYGKVMTKNTNDHDFIAPPRTVETSSPSIDTLPTVTDLSRTVIRSSVRIDDVSIFLVQNPSRFNTDFLCLSTDVQVWADIDTIGDYKGIVNVADFRGARGIVPKSTPHVSYNNLRLWPIHLTIPPVAQKDCIKPVYLYASGRMRQAQFVRTPGTDTNSSSSSVLSIPSLYTIQLASNQAIGVRIGYHDMKVLMDAVAYITVNVEQYLPSSTDSSVRYQSIRRRDYETHNLADELHPLTVDEDTVSIDDDTATEPVTVASSSTAVPVPPLVLDPHKLSLVASVVLPSVLVTLVNDYGNTELPLIVCGINDIRVSALGFHVQDRLLCNAGLAIYADYFNALQSIFEPLIEHWSCKWYLLRSEPLSANICTFQPRDGKTDVPMDNRTTDTPDGDASHIHLLRGIRTDRSHKLEKVRLIDGARLYEIEDTITGIVSEMVPAHPHAPSVTVPSSGPANVPSSSTAGTPSPPPKIQRGRLKRMFGMDQEEKAVQLSTALAYDYHLAYLPYVEGIKHHPRIDINDLPADILMRLEAKKPLQMNFSGIILNSLLDSLDTITKQMYSASGAESLYIGGGDRIPTVRDTERETSEETATENASSPRSSSTDPSAGKTGFNVFVRNACSDSLMTWIEGYQYDRIAHNYHHPLRSSNVGDSFRPLPTKPFGMLFPTYTSVHEHVLHDASLTIPSCILSPLRILPSYASEWTNIAGAGTVISYLARKDAWFRSYVIVTMNKQLFWWDTEPVLDEKHLPPVQLRNRTVDSSLPAWTSTAARSFPLDSTDTYRTVCTNRVTNPLVRIPSEYVFEIQRCTQQSIIVQAPAMNNGVEDNRTTVSQTMSGSIQPIPQLIFCVTTVEDYQLWRYLFQGLGLLVGSGNGTPAVVLPWNPLALPEVMLPSSRSIGSSMDHALPLLGSANRKLATDSVSGSFARSFSFTPAGSGSHRLTDSTVLPPLAPSLDLQLQNAVHTLPYRYRDRSTLPSFSSDSSLASRDYRRFLAEQRQRRKVQEVRHVEPQDTDRSVPLLNISDKPLTSSDTMYRPVVKVAVNGIPEVWKRSITDTTVTDSSVTVTVPSAIQTIWDIPVDKIATYLLPWSNPYAIPNPWELIHPRHQRTNGSANDTKNTRNRNSGTTMDTLPTAAGHKLGQCVIADVRYEQGLKTLILRSTVVIRNYLTVPLLVQFDDYNDRLIQRLRLSPGQSAYAPLQAAANGKVRFAPLDVTGSTTNYRSSTNDLANQITIPVTEDTERIRLPHQPPVQDTRNRPEGSSWSSSNVSTGTENWFGEATNEGNGIASLPIIYDNALPLSAITPYPLSSPPISLIDAAFDEQYHAGRRGMINTLLTGPEHVPTTNFGSTVPISCTPYVMNETVPPSLPSLPSFHGTAHILRPSAGPFRPRNGTVFSNLRKSAPSFRSPSTDTGTNEDDDQIYLVPDDEEFGLLTDTNVNITGTTMDGLSSNTVNDRFTTVINILPSLMVECLLPFPISYRIHPIRLVSNSLMKSSSGSTNNLSGTGKHRILLPPIQYGTLLPAESQQILFAIPPTYEDTMIPSFGDLVLSIRIDAPGYEPYGWTVVEDLSSTASFVPLSTEILNAPSESTTKTLLKREFFMFHTLSKLPPPGSRIYGNDADTERRIGTLTYLRLEAEKQNSTVGGIQGTNTNDYTALLKAKKVDKTFAPLYIHLERNFIGSAIGIQSSATLDNTLLSKLGQHASSAADSNVPQPTGETVELIQARLRSTALHLRIFIPYWMINKCDIPLMYRSSKPEQVVLGSRALSTGRTDRSNDGPDRETLGNRSSSIPRVPLELFSFHPDTKTSNKTVSVTDPTVRTKWSNRINVEQIGTYQDIWIPQRVIADQDRSLPDTVIDNDESVNDYDLPPVDRVPLMKLAQNALKRLEHQLCYTLQIDVGPGSFSRSRIVTFVNRYLMINRSGYSISWRQEQSKRTNDPLLPVSRLAFPSSANAMDNNGNDSSSSSSSDAVCITGVRGFSSSCSWMPLHWSDIHGARKIQLRLDVPLPFNDDDALSVSIPTWNWSIPLALNDGSWSLKLRRYLAGPHNETSYIGTDENNSTGNTEGNNGGSTLTAMHNPTFPSNQGVSPDQSTFLRLSIITTNGTTLVSIDRHSSFLPVPLQLANAMYRIDNHSSIFGVQIRQQGRGPSVYEIVPCYGTYRVAPYPYATDILTHNPVLSMNLVPVGLFAFIHWRTSASNTVGYYLRRRQYTTAAYTFVQAAMHGMYPSTRFRHRHNNSWATWHPTEGNRLINIDEIGAETQIGMHVKQLLGSFVTSPEHLSSLVRIRVYADTSTGPTKVIHISDAPIGSEATDVQTSNDAGIMMGEEASSHYRRTQINTLLIEYLVSHIQLLHQSLVISERLRDEITAYENVIRGGDTNPGMYYEGPTSNGTTNSSFSSAFVPVQLQETPVPPVTLQSSGEGTTEHDHTSSVPTHGRLRSFLSAPRSIAQTLTQVRENRYSGGSMYPGPALVFQILSGVDLAISDISGSSDPCCVLHIEVLEEDTRSKSSWKSILQVSTMVCRATLDPVWNYSHTCYFPVPPNRPESTNMSIHVPVDNVLYSHFQSGHELRFHLYVYDYDLHSKNDLLGHCVIPLGRRLFHAPIADSGTANSTNGTFTGISDRWYPLMYAEKADIRPSGSIRFRYFYAAHSLARVYFNFARHYLSNAINETVVLKERMIKRLITVIEQNTPTKGGLLHEAEESQGGGSGAAHVQLTSSANRPPSKGGEGLYDRNSGIHILQQVDHLRGLSSSTSNALRQIMEEYVRLEALPRETETERRLSLPEQELSLPYVPSMVGEGTGPGTIGEKGQRSLGDGGGRTIDTAMLRDDELGEKEELIHQHPDAVSTTVPSLNRQPSGESTSSFLNHPERLRDPITVLEGERQQRGEITGLPATLAASVHNVSSQAKEVIGLDSQTGLKKGSPMNTPSGSDSKGSVAGTGTGSFDQRGRVIGHQLEVDIVEARGLTPTLLQVMKERLPGTIRSMVCETTSSSSSSGGGGEEGKKGRSVETKETVPLNGRMYAVVRAGDVVRRTLPSAVTLTLTFYPNPSLGLLLGPSKNCTAIEKAWYRQQQLFTTTNTTNGFSALSVDGSSSSAESVISANDSFVSAPYHRHRSMMSMFTDIPTDSRSNGEDTSVPFSSSSVFRSRASSSSSSNGSTKSAFMLRPDDPSCAPIQIIGVQESSLRSSLVLPIGYTWETVMNILSSGQYTCLQVNESISLTGQTFSTALGTLQEQIQSAKVGKKAFILRIGLSVVPDAMTESDGTTVSSSLSANESSILTQSFQPSHVGWNQVVDFDDHVYPPRPRFTQPSSPHSSSTVTVRSAGMDGSSSVLEGRIGSGAGIPVHLQYDPMASSSSSERTTGSVTSGTGSTHHYHHHRTQSQIIRAKDIVKQVAMPSFLSLSVYARSNDNADEYPINGGTLIGADSADTEATLGKDKDTGIIATASRVVGKAVTTAVTTGEGMKDIVSAGVHGMGQVLSSTARSIHLPGSSSTKGEEEEGLSTDATYRPFSSFIPSPLRAVQGRENLPSGAVSSSDVLIAHREFIPVPSQDDVLDTWISLETVDNPYLYGEEGTGKARTTHSLLPCLPRPAEERQAETKRRTFGIHVGTDTVDGEGDTGTTAAVRLRLRWVPLYAAKKALRSLRIQAFLAGIKVSVIDFEPKELILLSLDNLHVDASLYHSGKATMDTGLQTVRVMNMLRSANRPVIFGPGSGAGGEIGDANERGTKAEEGTKGRGNRSDDALVPVRGLTASDQYTSYHSSLYTASPLEPDGISVHLTLQNHPTVIYVKDILCRIRHHSVALDDAIALELIQFISKLHLATLFSTSIEETNYAKVLDNVYQREDGGESTDRLALRMSVSTPTIQRSALSAIGPGYTMLVPPSLVSPSPFTVGRGSGGNVFTYSNGTNGGREVHPIQLIPSEDITSSRSNALARSVASPSHSQAVFALLNRLAYRTRLPNDHLREQLFGSRSLRSLDYAFDIASLQSTQRLYLRTLQLYSVSLDVSFELTNPALLAEVLPNSALLSLFKAMLQSVGTALANIEHAPIQLSGVVLSNLFETPPAVGQRLAGHYIQQSIMQWYRILGSISFLGNPLGLVSGIGRDTFDLASQATTVLDDPAQVTKVLRTSAVNLAQNTTVGILDSARQVFSSASKGVKGLHSASESYLGGGPGGGYGGKDTRFYLPPSTAWEGFKQGTYVFGSSLVNAGEGLVEDPYRAARYGGLIGLGKGLTSGILGVVTKPIAGALDGITLLLMGSASSANPNGGIIARTRLPRYINPSDGGRLFSWSERESEGSTRLWLLQLTNPYLREETYVYHCSLYGFVGELGYEEILPKDVRYRYVHDGIVWMYNGKEFGGETLRETVVNSPRYVGAVERLNDWMVRKGWIEEGDGGFAKGTDGGTGNVRIDTGKKNLFGIPFPRAPFTQRSPLLGNRGTTTDTPYVLLLTNRSMFILHRRTNAPVWYSPITFDSLLGCKVFSDRTMKKISSMMMKGEEMGDRSSYHSMAEREEGTVSESGRSVGTGDGGNVNEATDRTAVINVPDRSKTIRGVPWSNGSQRILHRPMLTIDRPLPYICSVVSSVTGSGIRICGCTDSYSPYVVEELVRMLQQRRTDAATDPRVWLRNVEGQIQTYERQNIHRIREDEAVLHGMMIRLGRIGVESKGVVHA